MKSKWFKENGFLSDEGDKAFLEVKTELENLLDTDEVRDMTISELQTLGSCLAKLTADRIHDKIVHRQRMTSELETMTDDQFYAYLKDKYGEHVWQFCTLSPEELARCPVPSLADFEKIMQENAKNFEFHYPTKIGGVQRF